MLRLPALYISIIIVYHVSVSRERFVLQFYVDLKLPAFQLMDLNFNPMPLLAVFSMFDFFSVC